MWRWLVVVVALVWLVTLLDDAIQCNTNRTNLNAELSNCNGKVRTADEVLQCSQKLQSFQRYSSAASWAWSHGWRHIAGLWFVGSCRASCDGPTFGVWALPQIEADCPQHRREARHGIGICCLAFSVHACVTEEWRVH